MRLWVVYIACLSVAAGSLADAQPHIGGKVDEVMFRYPPDGFTITPGQLVWSQTVEPPVPLDAGSNTRVRVRFSDIVLPTGDRFLIEIADGNGVVHDVLDRERLEGHKTAWSMFIPGQVASVRVRGEDAVSGFTFVIDRILFPFTEVAPESFFGPGQLTDIVEYHDEHADVVVAVASSVAKIEYIVDGQSDACTAFRIDAHLIQTSAHCVDTSVLCETAVAQFGFQKNDFGAFDRGQQVRCVEVVAKEGDDGADTAVLRVVPKPEDHYAIAEFRDRDPTDGEPLFVVQHPGGEVKKVSIVDCAVFDNEETAANPHGFGHSCDTKAGSSGSPVFDLEGRVVGQQRAGHRNPDVTNQPNLATLGSLLQITTVNLKAALVPRGIDPWAAAANGASLENLNPLPLPVAPIEGAEGDAYKPGDANISSPGFSGINSVIPDTGQ